MSIMKVRLYYHYCPAAAKNLTVYPRTVAGGLTADLVKVTGSCVDNAIVKEGKDILKNLNKSFRFFYFGFTVKSTSFSRSFACLRSHCIGNVAPNSTLTE